MGPEAQRSNRRDVTQMTQLPNTASENVLAAGAAASSQNSPTEVPAAAAATGTDSSPTNVVPSHASQAVPKQTGNQTVGIPKQTVRIPTAVNIHSLIRWREKQKIKFYRGEHESSRLTSAVERYRSGMDLA